MKINILIENERRKKPSSEEEAKKRYTKWPFGPPRISDDPEYVLDVCFFDGTSKPDSSESSGWGIVNHWKNFKGDSIQATHNSEDGVSYNFFQNGCSILQEDLEADWDGSLTGRDYGIFDRKPMDKILLGDFILNGEVIPVGISKPNFEVTLLYPEQEVDAVKVDLKTIFQGGVFGATADTLIDDTENTGYRIWSPPLSIGHLKIKEKTFNSVIMHIGAAFDTNWTVKTGLLKQELEGCGWLGFDTRDTDNYKLTLEPRYDAEAYTEPPVRMISMWTKLRVFTFPRKWWVWFNESSGTSIKGTGVWLRPPYNFEMPPPRKLGNWELASDNDTTEWDQNPPEDPNDPWYTSVHYNENDTHARFSFSGDSADRNAMFTLYVMDQMINAGLIGGDVDQRYHVPWTSGGLLNPDQYDSDCWRDAYYVHDAGSTADKPSERTTTGFFCTMPDTKIPVAAGVRSFYPYESSPDNEEQFANHLRNVSVYDASSYPQDSIDLINRIKDAAILVANEAGATINAENIQTWGIAAAGADEGDLVAVLECGDGQPIYVWRKTLEVFEPTEESDLIYANDMLVYNPMVENFCHSRHYTWNGSIFYGTEYVHTRGFIEWPFCVAVQGVYPNSNLPFNRVIAQWGSWANVWKDAYDYWYTTLHRGTITLQQPVSVVAYFGMFPRSNVPMTGGHYEF